MENNSVFSQAREEAGYPKQQDLARSLGISVSYMSKIENGRKVPPLILAMRIAKLLNLSVETLFGQLIPE